MIAALHAAGIGAVMDVVYNHMYRSENPLNSTVPYYFFRQNPDGSFSNGSGCGNEFASERPMARKYLIDSVLYWAQEYHIDGFRFDLMGLYDVDTMNELRAALDALPGGRDILMYGEPWQGGGSQLHRYEANKANLAMLSDRIGIFCDDTRDVIKGGCFDAREPGYVEGKPGSFWDIGGAVAAWCAAIYCPPIRPPNRQLCVCPRQLYSLGQADSRAVCPSRVHCRRLGGTGPEPAGGGHLPHLHGDALHAGRRGVRPHQKGTGQHLPLLALPQPSGLEAGGPVPRPRGLLPGAFGPPRAVAPPERPGRGQPGGHQFSRSTPSWAGLARRPGDGAEWRALSSFTTPRRRKAVSLPDGQWKLLSDGVSSALWKSPSRVCGGEVTLLPCSATIFGRVGQKSSRRIASRPPRKGTSGGCSDLALRVIVEVQLLGRLFLTTAPLVPLPLLDGVLFAQRHADRLHLAVAGDGDGQRITG